MRPILLDTNAYSDFMQGVADIVEIIALADRIYLSSTVLGEILSGFAVGKREAQNRLELTKLLRSPRSHSRLLRHDLHQLTPPRPPHPHQ